MRGMDERQAAAEEEGSVSAAIAQRLCGRQKPDKQKFLGSGGQSRSRGPACASPVATLDLYCNIPEALGRRNVNFL